MAISHLPTLFSRFTRPSTASLHKVSSHSSGLPKQPRISFITLQLLLQRTTRAHPPRRPTSPRSEHLSPTLQLIDFDQACFYQAARQGEGFYLGIPIHYSPPEVLIDELAGAPADIWALACTLFRARSGKDSISGGWHFGLATGVLDDIFEVAPLGDCPPDLLAKWQLVEIKNGWPVRSMRSQHGKYEEVTRLGEEFKYELERAWQRIAQVDEYQGESELAKQVEDIWDADSEPEGEGLTWVVYVNDIEGQPQIGKEEAELLKDFLGKVIVCDPTTGADAKRLLEHEWLKP